MKWKETKLMQKYKAIKCEFRQSHFFLFRVFWWSRNTLISSRIESVLDNISSVNLYIYNTHLLLVNMELIDSELRQTTFFFCSKYYEKLLYAKNKCFKLEFNTIIIFSLTEINLIRCGQFYRAWKVHHRKTFESVLNVVNFLSVHEQVWSINYSATQFIPELDKCVQRIALNVPVVFIQLQYLSLLLIFIFYTIYRTSRKKKCFHYCHSSPNLILHISGLPFKVLSTSQIVVTCVHERFLRWSCFALNFYSLSLKMSFLLYYVNWLFILFWVQTCGHIGSRG